MMLDEDSFIAPAFVIPHIAFQAYMDNPWKMHPSQWRQYPAVPLIFPGTTLHLRAVRLSSRRSHPHPTSWCLQYKARTRG